VHPVSGFAGLTKPIRAWTPPATTSSASRRPPPTTTDRLLAEHAAEAGTKIRRGCELTGLSHDAGLSP
jgi:rifampicin monooxygenase